MWMSTFAAVFKIPSSECSREVYKVLPANGIILLKHLKFYFDGVPFPVQVFLKNKGTESVLPLMDAYLDSNLIDRQFGFLPLDNFTIDCEKTKLVINFIPNHELVKNKKLHLIELVFEKIYGSGLDKDYVPLQLFKFDLP